MPAHFGRLQSGEDGRGLALVTAHIYARRKQREYYISGLSYFFRAGHVGAFNTTHLPGVARIRASGRIWHIKH